MLHKKEATVATVPSGVFRRDTPLFDYILFFTDSLPENTIPNILPVLIPILFRNLAQLLHMVFRKNLLGIINSKD